MTEAADTSTQARPARAPRRAPDDLPFSFITAEHVAGISASRDEPEWLHADRQTAFERFAALP